MTTPHTLPPLDDCGFIRVPDVQPLWMKCDQCGKSDHFWLAETQVLCRCGARYDHAIRPDGQQIPVDQLQVVPFREGPIQLADLEWDPIRLGIILAGAVALLGAAGWWLLG